MESRCEPAGSVAFSARDRAAGGRSPARDRRALFQIPFDSGRAAALKVNIDEAERTDAFVARFGRLQDTLADKLLPALLAWLAEPVGAAIDNLDRGGKAWASGVCRYMAGRSQAAKSHGP
jgi:hypothetical protein